MEHAVLLYLALSGADLGTPADAAMIFALEEKLEQIIEQKQVGEFDGNEFGGGQCVLYMYGPDADRLFDAIDPVLKATSFLPASFAIKRYGGPQDPGVRQVRIDLVVRGSQGG